MFYKIIWNFLKLFKTPLIMAVLTNKFENVKLLLEQKGIDANAKDAYLF